MKIDRLLGILSVLANVNRITIQELAEKFEVSKRTIARDIDSLSMSGIPIVTFSGMGGGVAILEEYKLRNNVFSKEDIKNIFMALNGLKSISNEKAVSNLLTKLIPINQNTIFAESNYVMDLSSWFKESQTQKKVHNFHKAIASRKLIKLEYISKNTHSQRIVQPYKLVFKQSYWYLYGFCEDRKEFRLFKLNRIVSYEVMEDSFEFKMIENIDLNMDFDTDYFTANDGNELFEVLLEYDVSYEYYLVDKIDAMYFYRDLKKETGKGEIRFHVSNMEWISDLVFSLQDKVKVIYPPALKNEIKSRINKMNTIYKDDI